MGILIAIVLPFIIFVTLYMFSWIRVLQEYERGVVFRLGRLLENPAGPGIFVLFFPGIIDKMSKIDLRIVTMDVPPQDVITRDNVSIKVNAVVYYKVVDPVRAVMSISDANYHYATSQKAQTILRGIVGQSELDEVLAEREALSKQIQKILDEETDPWGIKVTNVEIKDVDLPGDMQRAMARQAEAERERRAKVIGAQGEYQAAEKLVQAADMMSEHPMAMQMRYLQTMVEVGAEHNSTLFFPIPIDIISAFSNAKGNGANQGTPAPTIPSGHQ